MSDKKEQVETLIDKAAGALKSEDALRFSQAACNVANALNAMQCVKPPVSAGLKKHWQSGDRVTKS